MKGSRSWEDLNAARLRKVLSTERLLSRLNSQKNSRLVPESAQEKWWRLLGSGWLQQGFLLMDFCSGGSLYFPLAGFSAQALEDLLCRRPAAVFCKMVPLKY
jgi:hypothetical protein